MKWGHENSLKFWFYINFKMSYYVLKVRDCTKKSDFIFIRQYYVHQSQKGCKIWKKEKCRIQDEYHILVHALYGPFFIVLKIVLLCFLAFSWFFLVFGSWDSQNGKKWLWTWNTFLSAFARCNLFYFSVKRRYEFYHHFCSWDH